MSKKNVSTGAPATGTKTRKGPASKPKTKLALLEAMLRRPDGATVDQISKSLDWQTHSVRGAMYGKRRGGLGYSRGALYYLLRNTIYIGRIAHRGASYAGQHPGIVPRDLWDQVQVLLTENRQGGARSRGSTESCLLSCILFDDRGNVMSPSHARKANGRRYRYYVSQAVLQGRQENAGSVRRISAEAIESLIERTLCKSLPNAKQTEWARFSIEQKREQIKHLVERITIRVDDFEIVLTEVGRNQLSGVAPSGSMCIATVMRPGVGGRQIVPRDGAAARVDRSLVKAIAWARDLRQRLERDGKSLDELAREDGCSRPYVSSMIRLAYLAPGTVHPPRHPAGSAHPG